MRASSSSSAVPLGLGDHPAGDGLLPPAESARAVGQPGQDPGGCLVFREAQGCTILAAPKTNVSSCAKFPPESTPRSWNACMCGRNWWVGGEQETTDASISGLAGRSGARGTDRQHMPRLDTARFRKVRSCKPACVRQPRCSARLLSWKCRGTEERLVLWCLWCMVRGVLLALLPRWAAGWGLAARFHGWVSLGETLGRFGGWLAG